MIFGEGGRRWVERGCDTVSCSGMGWKARIIEIDITLM